MITVEQELLHLQSEQSLLSNVLITDADTLIKMSEGKIGIEAAYLTGKIKAEGDLGKGLMLKELTPKKVKKTAAKKKK